MLVKKFEARSVKEAIEMVKAQLGPDAIILNVRDNKKTYGLVGEGSVEITAAASEESMRKRQVMEASMTKERIDLFARSPAKIQKQMIEKFDNRKTRAKSANNSVQRRYVDIEDDGSEENFPEDQFKSMKTLNTMNLEAARASREGQNQEARQTQDRFDLDVIKSLQGEIKTLKQIITQFQNVPQNIKNSTYPGADYGLTYEVSGLYQKLTEFGVAAEIASEILLKVSDSLPPSRLKNKSVTEGFTAREILESIQVKSQPLNSRIHTFMGPPGSGKTSLLIKLASHLIAKENKTVMIATTDTFKVGATDQMRIFSQILNVPFAIIRATNDWVNILKAAQSFDYLFVDYPGLTMRTTEEQNLLERLLPPAGVSRDLHLVLSATDQDQFITEAGARYQKIGYDDVSFNFLDETFHHGSIYNFQNRFKCPYLSFGLGKKIPDDFEFATQERVLDLVLKVTQTMENRKTQHDTNSI
ncbi:MAG: flagellar biosynthesis protein FlhF [Pseudobdellovibrionaceae bacterium]